MSVILKPPTVEEVANLCQRELHRAMQNFGAFNSAHEGYAVLKEELDELWDAIKDKRASREDLAVEAIQVGAMAMRFLLDICPEECRKAMKESEKE